MPRRLTTKARVYENCVRKDRLAWRESLTERCMACSSGWLDGPLHVHEIERRSHAPGRWGVRCNYLLLCDVCHEGPFDSMDHAEQLAVKLVKDREHFDLEEWLRIKDPELKAPARVTIRDVARHLELKRSSDVRRGLAGAV